MLIQLTRNQMEILCNSLKEKVSQVYVSEGCTFNDNSTPSNYEILAREINNANKITALKDVAKSGIKPEWLSKFFYYQQKQDYAKFENSTLTLCSHYLQGQKWDVYSKNVHNQVASYEGRYKVYWKGTVFENEDAQISCDYDLIIEGDQCFLLHRGSESVLFTGHAPEYLGGNLYLTLSDKYGFEKVNMIIHMGIAKISKVAFLSGIFLSVDCDLTPCAGPLFLVKNESEKISNKIIENYFNTYSSKHIIKATSVNKMRQMTLKH